MNPILVAGLDPAFANLGIARMWLDLVTLKLTLDRFRTISTEKLAGKKKSIRQNSDDLRRARELHAGLHEELEGCTVAFAEIPSGAQAARASYGFGAAVGVLASCPIPLFQVMPLETKLGSVGNKKAEKPEIIAWAAERYPEAPWQRYEADTKGKDGRVLNRKGGLHLDNEHVADAIAIVHAGIHLQEFKQLLAMLKVGASANSNRTS
jgi:Holliday junction resolvasome RuvABC endonuclease subunit